MMDFQSTHIYKIDYSDFDDGVCAERYAVKMPGNSPKIDRYAPLYLEKSNVPSWAQGKVAVLSLAPPMNRGSEGVGWRISTYSFFIYPSEYNHVWLEVDKHYEATQCLIEKSLLKS